MVSHHPLSIPKNLFQIFFHFAALVHKLKHTSDTEYLCSFDISRLFTNEPLDEIHVDMFSHNSIKLPPFPENIFVK